MPRRYPSCIALSLLFAAVGAEAQTGALPDDAIVRALEEELQEARAVDANGIDVEVASGVATLRGTVDSILAKARAVRIGQMVRGVTAVVDLLEVSRTDRLDDDIVLDIETAFRLDAATDAYEVEAVVEDGNVTLTGTVDSQAERLLAEQVAKSVAGVRAVDNRIELSAGTARADSEIAADIEERLQWDARLDGAFVTVEVRDGSVELSGSVSSSYDVALASTLAWVQGTNSVDTTELQVQPWVSDDLQRAAAREVEDANVRQAVQKALMRDPRVHGFDVAAVVEKGVVTLTGEVDNLKAKRAAAETAHNAVGVVRVMNLVKVRPTILRDDVELGAAVIAALARDPLVFSADISVDLENGFATLSGTVDSPFERMHAADVAARVSGVLEVRNRLSVYDETQPYSYDYYDWDPVLHDYDEQPAGAGRSRTDAEIEADIERELFWSPRVDEELISVVVEDGIATLEGTVGNLHERRKATENALEGGAYRVRNRLTLSGD